MEKNVFLIIGLFPILLFLPITAIAENSSVTKHGFVGMDSTIYVVKQNESTLAKVSGIGDVPKGVDHEKATIIITQPDETTSNHRVFSTSDGYFELIFPLGYDSQIGTYKVFVTFAGQVLGELYFEVQREEPFVFTKDDSEKDRTFPFKTTSTYFETDSEYYEKGDDIHISGTISKVTGSAVAIQVFDSKNNTITIDQVKPKSDGTFSTIIKTNGNMWKFEGDYLVRSSYDNEKMETIFEFSIPKTTNNIPNPITSSGSQNINKIKTSLTLDNFQNTYDTRNVTISGYLIADGNGQAGATIHIIDNGVRLGQTIETDSNGYFTGNLSFRNYNTHHEVQVIYDGTAYFESSKSEIKNFDLVSPLAPPPVQPQSTSNPFDPTGIIVVVVLSVIVGIAVIALKRRKPTSNRPQTSRTTSTYRPPTNPNPPGNTESSTMFFYECPKCHGADIQNNPDGSVSCPDCGFRG